MSNVAEGVILDNDIENQQADPYLLHRLLETLGQ